jgi:hypothetical protein
MNWRRGLSRLWIVVAALLAIVITSSSDSGIKAKSAEYEADARKAEQEEVLSILAEFRRQYPQYDDLSNARLAEALELPLGYLLDEPSTD